MNKTSEQLGELFAALSKAQGKIKLVEKDASNPFFKSQYSTLGECWSNCRGPLSENGLTIVQTLEDREGKIFITTILGHASGQFISSTLPLLTNKQDPQSIGSAISYMRRYSLCAMIGLASGDEDDDAEKAMESWRKGQRNAQDWSIHGRAEESPSKQKIVDPMPKERGLSLDQFVESLRNHDKSFEGLAMDEYLMFLSEKKNVPLNDIQNQALRPEFTVAFLNGYAKWYEKRSNQE